MSIQITQNDKKVISAALLAVVLLVGLFYAERARKEQSKSVKNDIICIQVVTKARNPKTGEIREFSTPCDVPVGWIKSGINN